MRLHQLPVTVVIIQVHYHYFDTTFQELPGTSRLSVAFRSTMDIFTA